MKTRPIAGIRPAMFGLLFVLTTFSVPILGQPVFNANFGTFKFLNASKVHKVGTDGSAVGNITLYTNVITINGQPIDCIVKTVSLTNGVFSLPGGAPTGTIPFDYSSATGSGLSANQDRFFAPMFTFNNGGGSCKFQFEFILGGSFNNTTKTGTPVYLQNVPVNTYDIDGMSGSNGFQYNEFGGFSTVTVSQGSNISSTYNTATGLTKFQSTSTANSQVVTADKHRVYVTYDQISTFEIMVGATSSGDAYFFLDFSTGPAWTGPIRTDYTPLLDLSGEQEGIDNFDTHCGGPKRMTDGPGFTSITQTSGSVNEIIIRFNTASIINGNAEVLIPKGSTNPAADSIRLGFSGSSNQTFTLNGILFKAAKSTTATNSYIRLSTNSGAAMSNAQAEMLLDSLYYANMSANPTYGSRTFYVSVREASLTSPEARFVLNELCLLPVKWEGVEIRQGSGDLLIAEWEIIEDNRAKAYQVEWSADGKNWHKAGETATIGEVGVKTSYQLYIHQSLHGVTLFRVQREDLDGRFTYSPITKLGGSTETKDLMIWPNPTQGPLKIQCYAKGAMMLTNQTGAILLRRNVQKGLNDLNLVGIKPGMYFLQFKFDDGSTRVSRLIKN